MTRPGLLIAVIALAAAHLAVIFAGFLSPYDPTEQRRDEALAPPTAVHFIDDRGAFHLRPFVLDASRRAHPVRFFIRRDRVRLFGVDPPGDIHLLGTDGFGRDQLSRVLHGGRVSLAAGLLAAALSLAIGACAGSLAGMYGRWCDAGVMRLAELFLAVPWLYILLAFRAALPLTLDPAGAFLLIVGVIGIVGWARPARLVRGVILGVKELDYVQVSSGFGASRWHVLRTHILPDVGPVLATQASLLIPQYIMAEVALSFLGLGAGEPSPSWGGMLAVLRQPGALTGTWWLAAPVSAVFLVSLCYYVIARSISEPPAR